MRVRNLGVILFLSSAICAARFSSADAWTSVATAGLGFPQQGQVDGMLTLEARIFLATHDTASGEARIFLASVRDDRAWSEDSPPFAPGAEVTAMHVHAGELWMATTAGELWRRDPLTDTWEDATPALPGAVRSILALGSFGSARGRQSLCLVRSGLELRCSEDPHRGGFTAIALPADLTDDTLQSARLFGNAVALYLGAGGDTAGSAACQVWRWQLSDRIWRPVSADCFGRGEDITWVLSLAEYAGRIYIGTGGHAGPGLYRAVGSAWEDVTPRALYDFENPFSTIPIRYQAMAVLGRQLYVGTRTSALCLADVIATVDGRSWGRANESGFIAGHCNDSVTALAGHEAWLYAGTFNTDTGFEVWRREPTAAEVLPYQFADLRELGKRIAPLPGCLFPPQPRCPFDLGPLDRLLGNLRFRFQRLASAHPRASKLALEGLRQAGSEFRRAEAAAKQALTATSRGAASRLRTRAIAHLHRGFELASDAVVEFDPSLDGKGG